ncbi:DUF3592 domain-containing protein [Blastococcus sp. TF02-8]|uniref:DUF3592 domain-containing protein n=1 Tax=Blastococcus sp. TF02-8 TaxID=2250574 RepID=UPI0011BE6C40|nr:DUF3592 domain-containing protein [Blastococcus sp. TF02-8]
MISLVAMLVAVGVGVFLVTVLLLRQASPHTAVVVRGRLLRADGRGSRGRVRLTAADVTWRERGHEPVGLRGPVRLGPTGHASWGRQATVRLQLWTAEGRQMALDLPAPEAAATVRLLSGQDPVGLEPWRATRARGTAWAAAFLTLAVGFAGLMFLVGTDGYTADATVLSSDDGWTCEVAWTDPTGTAIEGRSDCFGERAGSRLEVLVPWGEIEDPVSTRPALALSGGVVAAPLLAVGALLAWRVARHRRRDATFLRLVGAEPPRAGESSEAALAEPRTASAVARRRRWSRVGLIGVAASLLLSVGMWLVQDHADRQLRAEGATTVGTVVELHPEGRRRRGGLDVRFTVDGTQHRGHVPGDSNDYDLGQHVEVFFDPADPDRFTIDDVTFEPRGTALLLTVGGLGSLSGIAYGLPVLLSHRRARSMLARGVWSPVMVRARYEKSRYLFTAPDGTTWRSSRRAGWPTREDGTEPVQDAWWVRDGEHAVFSPDKGAPLVRARLS